MRVKTVFGVVFCILGFVLAGAQAQTDCGIVSRIAFPIPSSFRLVQDYAVSSVRHQGRFHTGEDWYGVRNATEGQPVTAIAEGRVTYSSVNGWGRDGGVVIIEHRLADGGVIYSLYGHMKEADGIVFPTRFGCVGIGEVIGAIADVRPAPHLHFEIRTQNPDTPGAGYIRENPNTMGYLRPSEFIINQQAYLSPSYAWHFALSDEHSLPAFSLNDNSLLLVDHSGALRRILPDGRVLWRTRLNTALVAISAFQGQSLLTFADGTMQFVDVETGTLGESWRVPNLSLLPTPIVTSDWLVFNKVGGGMVAIGTNRREVAWDNDDLPTLERAIVVNEGVNALIAGITPSQEVVILSASGVQLAQTSLRRTAFLAESPEKDVLAYTWGGLWQIGIEGEWVLWQENTPKPEGRGALAQLNGAVFVHDGELLTAYGRDKAVLWQTPLAIGAPATLTPYGNTLLLISEDGLLATLNANDGRICNQLDVYNGTQALVWHTIGSDNVLRVALSSQVIALDWTRFKGTC